MTRFRPTPPTARDPREIADAAERASRLKDLPHALLQPDRGSVLAEMRRIAAALEAVRLPSDTEARLQAAIGETLTAAGIEHARELVLGPSERYDHLNDRIDFAVERAGVAIGIEAKVGGARLAVWRQLEAYARHDRLHGIILVGAVAMPDIRTIQRKPFRHVSIQGEKEDRNER